MREAGGEACAALAASEPLSACGSAAAPPVERSVARADLFCEMLTWQREELGDGNAEEFKNNGCPWPAKQGDGADRKGSSGDSEADEF
mmetsp:Transcript_96337/g.300114  ORF Transcript_96337/g.300114 Transcript_96337/m.300114 type:complete len:88 (+) Transcript_96337:2-265(+)